VEAETGRLLAISDLHVSYKENREHAASLRPGHPGDWLLVAGDVAEKVADVESTLALLAERFAKVVWTPGNHELWTTNNDPEQVRGVARYERLVEVCRGLGVVTPEDPYVTWRGITIVPLFLGYDYTWRPEGATSRETSLEIAREAGVVCTDEYFLHPDPFPSRDAWCADRVLSTRRRLDAEVGAAQVIFVNHYPLVRDPTRVLRYPEFAQWCGTEQTADWHTRYHTACMVYGHLHIPRTTFHDGVRFEEVSVGYPREWRRFGGPPGPRQILPYVPS
jgi:3',5'-cyclic AMP phosphodiesterase CpdA